MKSTYRALLIALAFLFSFLLMMSEAEANEWLELKSANLEYRRFINAGTDVLLYPRIHKDVINLQLDMDVLRYFYWTNTIMGLTDTAQFRAVSWEYQFGLRVSNGFSVFYHHRSQHILDGVQSYLPRYPLDDSVGFSITIHSSRGGREYLF